MIQFKPFRAVRPAKNRAQSVTTQNVDYYSKDEIEKTLSQNPDSYLQIIKPTLVHSEDAKSKRYDEVRHNFEQFMDDEVMMRDLSSFYIYQQENRGSIITGVIGLVSVDDFNNGLIKKHENTIEEREKIFANYLNSIHIQADPVLLTFPENQSIELLFSMVTRQTPTLEFTGMDNRPHRLWQVKDRLIMKQLKDAIEKLDALYIGDGHHRMSSGALYSETQRNSNEDYHGLEAFNYTMAILIPSNQLQIFDFNRMVKDLNGLSEEEFLAKVSEIFTVLEKDEPYYPSHKNHISMYLNGKYYGLYVHQELRGVPKGLGELDTFLWEEHLMRPILGIENSRTDKRIGFSKGTGDINGILKMQEKVDSGEYKVAFGFYPISFPDLQLVADLNLTMPPKSTYIEPKFLSAMTIFDLAD
ncbi:MAG: DUF1015 domain-containing protein [Weeksellaceae bacterium]|nr:DUF1015 domain-containing protein [Weeksellaceae bacterium]